MSHLRQGRVSESRGKRQRSCRHRDHYRCRNKGPVSACWLVLSQRSEPGCSRIRPGGTVVEGSAGNTAIGLAHVCRSRGYHCVIFMPNNQVSCCSPLSLGMHVECSLSPTEPRESEHPAHARCGRIPRSRGSVRRPTKLQPPSREVHRYIGERRMDQPVRQHRKCHHALSHHRSRDLGANPR